jgi:hypothetical protein
MLNEHDASSDAVGGKVSDGMTLQTQTIELLHRKIQIGATSRGSMLIKSKGYMRTWLLSSTASAAGVSKGIAVNDTHEAKLEAALGFITPPPPPADASLQQDNDDSSDNRMIRVHFDLQ